MTRAPEGGAGCGSVRRVLYRRVPLRRRRMQRRRERSARLREEDGARARQLTAMGGQAAQRVELAPARGVADGSQL